MDDISYEIKKLNSLFTLIENKDTNDKDQLIELLSNLPDPFFRYFFQIENKNSSLSDLKLIAGNFIKDTINKEIAQVSPLLTLNPSNNNKFDTKWSSPTLISSLYTMLYIDLIQGKEFRKCKNITCPEHFEIYGNDKRKEFCTTKCAQAYASREYRKRVKNKKVKEAEV